MNLSKKLVLTSGLLLALGACNSADKPLKDFVARTVKLEYANGNTFNGTLTFEKTTYYTELENECDRVVCGYQPETTCDYATICDDQVADMASTDLASEARPGGGGGGGGMHGGPGGGGGDHDGGHGPGGFPGGPGGHGGGGDHDGDHDGGWHGGHGGGWCRTVPVNCRTWDEPLYCDTNCRQVPVQRSKTEEVNSTVTAYVSGTADPKSLDLALGVKTNDAFQNALANASARPKDSDYLFTQLNKDDRSLLILNSEKYVLTPGQNFLQLPANFKQGDPIELNIQVESASNPNAYSVLGSPVDVPALNYVQQ